MLVVLLRARDGTPSGCPERDRFFPAASVPVGAWFCYLGWESRVLALLSGGRCADAGVITNERPRCIRACPYYTGRKKACVGTPGMSSAWHMSSPGDCTCLWSPVSWRGVPRRDEALVGGCSSRRLGGPDTPASLGEGERETQATGEKKAGERLVSPPLAALLAPRILSPA